MVSARGLEAAYGNNVVLHGVNFDLRLRESVVLVGRNGAGKTTLLRCLAGLHAPLAGAVECAAGPPRPGIDVALCAQRPEAVLFRDTVADEVTTTLQWRDRSGRAGDLIAAFGLPEEILGRHPRDLSAGQRQLVAIAAVAATGAPILLLDEPSRGLDPESKRQLVSFLRDYVRDDRAVMLVTHDVELAALVAERVIMLAAGEIVAEGSPEEVLGDSPVFAPQTARVFGPQWLTPQRVADAVAR